MCAVLEVSDSGYYARRSRPHNRRKRQDMRLKVHVKAAFARAHQAYGSPRLTHELQASGIAIGRRRVARLMRESSLSARPKKRFVRTTDSAHGLSVSANILGQDFCATHPNQKWGADMSYIWTRQGWLYLAVVIDLYARRVIGWAVSDRLHTDLPLTALKRALAIAQPKPGLIHHSDRGSQYCAGQYQKLLEAHRITSSMSAKGNCYDNAMVETFFKTIKTELIWKNSFKTKDEAKAAIDHYINGFYNPVRRHSALNYISPIQFEKLNT